MTVRVAARHPARGDDGTGVDRWVPVRADLRDPHSVQAALDGADAAVNAVSLYVESRDATYQAIHVDGAGQLARAAAEAGLDRLLHISGIGADARSTSAYIRARRGEGEDAARADFPGATILGPSVMFGPDDAFLTTLVGLVRRLPIVPLFGDGTTRLQPVHVEDVAAAVAILLTVSDPPAPTHGKPAARRSSAIVRSSSSSCIMSVAATRCCRPPSRCGMRLPRPAGFCPARL